MAHPNVDLGDLGPSWWSPSESEAAQLLSELHSEMPDGHALEGTRAVPIAVKKLMKDLILWLPDRGEWAKVHLTYSSESDPRYPWTSIAESWEALVMEVFDDGPDRVPEMRTHLRQMVEAIAVWRLGLPGGRELLASSAADLVAAGADGSAVIELASIYPGENALRIDAMVAALIPELSLEAELSEGLEGPATRWMARSVLSGRVPERELSRWAHSQFHHESESEPLNDLAELDDQYDDAEAFGTSTESIRYGIRAIARQIVSDE